MKKNKISKYALMFIPMALLFNSVTFSQEYEEDVYLEDSEVIEQKNTNTNKNNKKVKNPFEGIFTPKQKDYNFYETINISTGDLGYGIKHRQAEVFVNPKDGMAGVQTYFQTSYFDFMFTRTNLELIEAGYERYLEDFENHTLIKKKTMKTRQMYSNKGKCRVEWGTVKSMMNNYGDAYFHVGYEFKKNTPYFCIIIKDCKNIAKDLGPTVPEKSVEVQLYFTKAEAKAFLEVLSKERVNQELGPAISTEDQY